MKTHNDLAGTLTEAELEDVRGGLTVFAAPLAQLTRSRQDADESLERLAVLDPAMFESLLPKSPFGSLLRGDAVAVPDYPGAMLIRRG
jgi:hypothetical protein